MVQTFTVQEAADITGVSRSAIHRLNKKGVVNIRPLKKAYVTEKDIKTLKEYKQQREANA